MPIHSVPAVCHEGVLGGGQRALGAKGVALNAGDLSHALHRVAPHVSPRKCSLCMWMCVGVCVCVSERSFMRDKAGKRCVYACYRERERESVCVCACNRERERESVCVCVRECASVSL